MPRLLLKIFVILFVVINGIVAQAQSLCKSVDKNKIEEIIKTELADVRIMLFKSRDEIKKIITQKNNFTPKYDYSIYTKPAGGTFSDHYHQSDSNIFISIEKPINAYIKDFIRTSERFETVLRQNREMYPTLGWQYVLEYKYDSMRFYPWFDPDNIMGKQIDWSKFAFYRLSIANDNENVMVCAPPGLDVGGLGYIFTCSVPINISGEKYGLLGVDIVMGNQFENLISQLGDNNECFAMLIHDKKKLILLKPAFFGFLYNNIMNLSELKKQNNDVWLVNDDYYKGELVALDNSLVDYGLLYLKRVYDE